MKLVHCPTAVVVLAFALLIPVPASALDLDSFLGEINVTARADLGSFRADLSATFGVSSREVDGLFRVLGSPADVYMSLRIGEVTKVPMYRVVAEYQANKNKGWGVIARNLGIKPGSAEFHALKQGRLAMHGQGGHSYDPGKGHGAGKAKGKK
jgi:hypothetical protein